LNNIEEDDEGFFKTTMLNIQVTQTNKKTLKQFTGEKTRFLSRRT